jgi:hypothetical protein
LGLGGLVANVDKVTSVSIDVVARTYNDEYPARAKRPSPT